VNTTRQLSGDNQYGCSWRKKGNARRSLKTFSTASPTTGVQTYNRMIYDVCVCRDQPSESSDQMLWYSCRIRHRKLLCENTVFLTHWGRSHLNFLNARSRVFFYNFNPLNAELNPICYLLELFAHQFLHVSRIRVKLLTLRLLMLYIYIYIYGAPILDVSRSHTTTQHSR
jgi:hypothetical protein